MPPPSGRYRRSAWLTLRACDEGVLVFDEASGTTSVLNARAGDLLVALGVQDGAADLSQASASPEFEALLSSLENAGLIVPC